MKPYFWVIIHLMIIIVALIGYYLGLVDLVQLAINLLLLIVSAIYVLTQRAPRKIELEDHFILPK